MMVYVGYCAVPYGIPPLSLTSLEDTILWRVCSRKRGKIVIFKFSFKTLPERKKI
jgi:hypothetical protein